MLLSGRKSLQAGTVSFNSRTHVGCDISWFKLSACSLIFQSTHPCRVRLQHGQVVQRHLVFQSTHPCRVRPDILTSYQQQLRFQSTHPCRVRRLSQWLLLLALSQFQSTHPCRVRQARCHILHYLRNFNPRTHVGCDEAKEAIKKFLERFQSTHPCRVRQARCHILHYLRNFNPRTHVGCDASLAPDTWRSLGISIHAPM